MIGSRRAGYAIAALLVGLAHADRARDRVETQLFGLAQRGMSDRQLLLRNLPNEDRVLVALVACLHDDDARLRRACADRLAIWKFADATSSFRRLALDALETAAVADAVVDVRVAAANAHADLTHVAPSMPAPPTPIGTVDVPHWRSLAGSPAVTRLWGTHVHDVYAIGPAGLHHSIDGGVTWPRTSIAGTVVFGTAPNDVWVAGARTVQHSTDGNGARWTSQPLTTLDYTATLESGWSASAQDVFVVGGERDDGAIRGVVVRSRDGGATWRREQLPDTTPRLAAVWGVGANDVFAVGDRGVVLHSTGDGSWQVRRDRRKREQAYAMYLLDGGNDVNARDVLAGIYHQPVDWPGFFWNL